MAVSSLNQRFSTKHLGEVEWYMGSEYKMGYFGDLTYPVHSERTESLWCFEIQPDLRYPLVGPQAHERGADRGGCPVP